MNILIKDEKKRYYKNRWKRFSSIAAVFLVILFSVAAVSISSVQGFRAKIYNWFFSENTNYVDINILDEEGSIELDKVHGSWDYVYVPTYIPSGYSMVETKSSPLSISIIFKNSDNEELFFIQENYVSKKVVADNEISEFSEMQIGSIKGYYIKNEYGNSLSWHNNDYTFSLSGIIELDEMIKTAENVKIQN